MRLRANWPRPADVFRRYRTTAAAIASARSAALAKAEEEQIDVVTARFLAVREEVEQQAVLASVASVEGLFRTDLAVRVRRRDKAAVSMVLRAEVRRTGGRIHDVRLEDIIDAWKTVGGIVQPAGLFLQLVNYRHWLAHGRYWEQTSGLATCDCRTATLRGRDLLKSIAEHGRQFAEAAEAADAVLGGRSRSA